MKKFLSLFALIVVLSAFSACQKKDDGTRQTSTATVTISEARSDSATATITILEGRSEDADASVEIVSEETDTE